MRDANGGTKEALGVIWSVHFWVGFVTVVCPVYIIEGVPFDLLLGQPFLCAAQATETHEENGAATIRIQDMKTGQKVALPTKAYRIRIEDVPEEHMHVYEEDQDEDDPDDEDF